MRARFGGKLARERPTSLPRVGTPLSVAFHLGNVMSSSILLEYLLLLQGALLLSRTLLSILSHVPPSPTRADERYNRSVGYVVLPAAPAVRLDHSRFDNAQTPRTRSINQKTCAMRPGGPAVPPPPAPDHHSSVDPYSARGCAVLGNQRISLQLSHSVIVLQCAKRTRHG